MKAAVGPASGPKASTCALAANLTSQTVGVRREPSLDLGRDSRRSSTCHSIGKVGEAIR